MKKKHKILRRILIVFLILIIVLLVLFGALILYVGRGSFSAGWDNVLAAVKGLTTSTEEIEQQIDEGRKQQVNILQQHGFNISEEDLKKIESGEFSDKDIQDLFTTGNGNDEEGKQQDDILNPNDVELSEDVVETDVGETPPEDMIDEPVSKDNKSDEETGKESEQTVTDTSDDTSDKFPAAKTDGDKTKVEKPDTSVTDGKKNESPSDSPVKAEENVSTDKSGEQADPKKESVKPDSDASESKSPNNEEAKTDTKTGDQSSSDSDEVDERIGEIIATMYVYKSQYTGSISSIVNTMYHQFYNLPKDQWTYSTKVSIYNQYAGQIASMEAQCDAQVYALVDELRQLLRANGRDESLADALLTSYNTEKENSKAYHISRYAD